MIGKTLGNFTILDQIGAGGMGVVYRAHDHRLERDVAIKVLPPHNLDNDSDRKRFRREALALSRLNHPNIASIYDFRSEDGIDFLVMELIPGIALDERLTRGPLEQAEVLRLGSQMAEGLSAAHAQGLIHRDLKPANLRLTPDGRLKILDFGLAKVLRIATAATATASITADEGIAGTVPYMAPEQLRAGETDHRSDIYSAGAVLYEMATARRPFESSGAQLIDSILNDAPPSASTVNRRVSLALEAIIDKAMDKNPERRYQSARELLVDLQRLHSPSTVRIRPAQSSRLPKWLIPVAALACVLVIAFSLLYWRRPPASQLATSALKIEQLTNFTDVVMWPALSPDGKILAFVRRSASDGTGVGISSTAQIYVKMLPDGEPVQLTHDDFNKGPLAFSPDGTRIAYTIIDKGFSWDTWIVPVLGGQPQRFLKNASGLFWAPNGKLIYSAMDRGIHMNVETSNEARTDVRIVYSPPTRSGMAHRSALSPDGKWLLLQEMDETGVLPCRVVPFDGSNSGKRVGPSGQCQNVAWSPDGKWMYFNINSGGAYHIWRQSFPDGTPEQLTSGPTEEQGIDIAPDGRSLITSMGTEDSTIWTHGPDGDRQVTFEGFTQVPIFSPVDTRLFYLQRPKDDNPAFVTGELWAVDPATMSRAPVLRGFRMTHFSISHDGQYVAFTVKDPAEQRGLWLAPLEGRSPPRRLTDGQEDRVFFLRNGDMITLSWDGTDRHLFRIGRDGSRSKIIEAPLFYLLALSPDDKWVVAATPIEGSETGSIETRAFSLVDGSSRLICNVCAPGGADARRNATVASWSGDGKTFYVSYQFFPGMGNRMFTITVPLRNGEMLPPLPAGGIDSPDALLKIPGATRIDERNIFPGKDSRHYAMRRILEKKNLFRITLPE